MVSIVRCCELQLRKMDSEGVDLELGCLKCPKVLGQQGLQQHPIELVCVPPSKQLHCYSLLPMLPPQTLVQLTATFISLLSFLTLVPSLSKARHPDCFIAFEAVLELSYCQLPQMISTAQQPYRRVASFQQALSPVISAVNSESNRHLPHFDMRCQCSYQISVFQHIGAYSEYDQQMMNLG